MAPVCYVVRQNRLDGWRHQHNQLVADLHRLTTPLNLAGVVAYKTNNNNNKNNYVVGFVLGLCIY